jgi:hypothetical protein
VREPAGYLVHFSPRDGQTRGSLLEFGFSGDQTLVAWAQLQFGYRRSIPLYRDRARKVLDFFVRHCQLETDMLTASMTRSTTGSRRGSPES